MSYESNYALHCRLYLQQLTATMVLFHVLEAAISVSMKARYVMDGMTAVITAMKIHKSAKQTVSHSFLINHSTNQLVRNRLSSGHLQISEEYGLAHVR